MRISEILTEKVISITPVDDFNKAGGTPVRVLLNPTVDEFETLVGHSEHAYDGVRYFILSRTGDLYVWDSYHANHDEIYNGLYEGGDLYGMTFFGHLFPESLGGKYEKRPVVQLDTCGWEARHEVEANRHLRRIMPRFRLEEID